MIETIAEILAAHATGRAPAETVRGVYHRIAAHDDPAIFITLVPEAEAVAAAEALAASGPAGKPLYGVPFAVKDNIDAAGVQTTAACPAFARTPEMSATVVQKLLAAGAILIGKTNLDQFATGLAGVRSPYGVPRNALNAELVPGGSSSGSAVAVAAGLVPFALGTDTAGSGRVPAALNGIVGLKPSLGLVSTRGVLPACRTLDCVSIFALDVADAVTVLQVAAAFDAADAYSRPVALGAASAPPPKMRIAIPRECDLTFFGDKLAADAFTRDCQRLRELGATLVEIDFEPFHAVARLLYEGPWVAERYAAIKPLILSNPDALHPITRKIIEGALQQTAVGTFEAKYKLAALRRATEAAWKGIDAIVVPTIPTIYTLADLATEPVIFNSYLGTYTNFVNLLDLCAIAVPSGARGDGMPSSLTLIGAAGQDAHLASIARAIQAHANQPMGATGRRPLPLAALPVRAAAPQIELAVVGAHLSGMPLNRELLDLSATFLRTAATVADYRLFALPGMQPPKPGLLRVASGAGHEIAVEVWSLSPAAFGLFVSAIPAPLGIGTLALGDGTAVKGFLCEAEALKSARDVSEFGGWRAFVQAMAKA